LLLQPTKPLLLRGYRSGGLLAEALRVGARHLKDVDGLRACGGANLFSLGTSTLEQA
jgi:hypothetical protein